ncbi:MAG: diacylglycerol/polyprenol kinase family protein [Akkermansiaceae bacterium]
MHAALSIPITLACLGVIILLSAWGVKTKKLSGELARKVVHVGMGLICMSFPWLFDSVLAVQLLAAFAIITLLVIRITKLRKSLGTALFSVERLSIGELLFPLAVAWLFTLGWEQPVLYCISLLLLTLADTAGALAGSKFGKATYKTTAATKSCEGSVAFFITAFLCISLPLHYFTELSLGLILFLALSISLFSMAVEGASGHGLDNLLIPIGSFLLLDYYVGLSDHLILIRALVLLGLLGLLILTRRMHTFDGGATLTSMLFGFAVFTLGGIPCLLAAVLIFVRHIMTQKFMHEKYVITHSLDTIVAIAIPSLFWLTLGRGEVIDFTHAQFAFISTLSLIIAMLHAGTQKHMHRNSPSLIRALVLCVVILSTVLLIDIPLVYTLPTLMLALPAAGFYFYWAESSTSHHPRNWLKLALLAMLCSAAASLPFLT